MQLSQFWGWSDGLVLKSTLQRAWLQKLVTLASRGSAASGGISVQVYTPLHT